MAKPTPWNAEEEQRLLQLRATGLHWREIAQKMGRTQAACEGRLTKLKPKSAVESDCQNSGP